MSFSGTPLGQTRRLDHKSFLGKPPSNGSDRPPSPSRIVPTSYSYGAPTRGSRSPTKPASPTRDRTRTDDDDDNEPALARFARLKQREQQATTNTTSTTTKINLSSRPGGPRLITTPPNPEKFAQKSTSVNVATAFLQAANDMSMTPNEQWAARPKTTVPRSTSVEYEEHARQAQVGRGLPAPRSRINKPDSSNNSFRRPLHKNPSTTLVPDSEGEEDGTSRPAANGRGKSPFEAITATAKSALGQAAFYLRQRSTEPQDSSYATANGAANNSNESYDYQAEEQAFQSARRAQTHKRGRMSTDNKAYKPSVSDEESEGSDLSDDGRRRKKGKKKAGKAGPGMLTSLPVIQQDKRRRKKKGKNTGEAGQEEEEEESGSDEASQSQTNIRASIPRQSRERSLQPDFSQTLDSTINAEQGLNSIPEVDEEQLQLPPEDKVAASAHQPRKRSRSRGTTPGRSAQARGFSMGAFLGTLVNRCTKFSINFAIYVLHLFTSAFFWCGRGLGKVYNAVFGRRWNEGEEKPPSSSLSRYLALAVVILGVWWAMKSSSGQLSLPSLPMPSWGSSRTGVFQPSLVPAGDISEFADRLQRIERALSGISSDTEKTRAKADEGARGNAQLLDHIRLLKGKLQAAQSRVGAVEKGVQDVNTSGVGVVVKEVEELKAEMAVRKRKERELEVREKEKEKEREKERIREREERERERERDKAAGGAVGGKVEDEEARSKIRVFEDRIGSIEGAVKEAIDFSKKAMSSVSQQPVSQSGSQWWQKLASGAGSKSGFTIKTTDGQDVTALISYLVESAVSLLSKDDIAKADYALQSGGARVIPSLTSPTLEITPTKLHSKIMGIFTNTGYAIGRPPITALHHDAHNGNCWPFKGTEGQLGVVLIAPIFVDEITLDHVAKETATNNLRSAPREMEVWGLVEGTDNIEKVREWRRERIERQRAAREALGDEANDLPHEADDDDLFTPPPTFPRNVPYIRIATFTYDIHASRNIQTFTVDPEVRALGVDFGVVVLHVLSNWGQDEFTCLYRFRVHGQRMEELPPTYSHELGTSADA